MKTARRIAKLLQELDDRIDDLESDRPVDAPETSVASIIENGVQTGDTVTTSQSVDFQFKYDVAGNGYDESEWA